MLWACVWLPSLALDTALRHREPPEQPFALVTGAAQQRRLLAVDARAYAVGLRPRQRLAEAEAIFPQLLTADHAADDTRASLTLTASWAYRYSSRVLIEPPRALMLEVEHSFRLFGSWPQIESHLRGDLTALGFHHHIALAPTPRAAMALAHVRDGAAITTVDNLTKALANIPVTQAGLPGTVADSLASMGMHTLGSMLALPRATLQRRFGKASVEVLDLLLGHRPDPQTPYRPPDRFHTHVDLGCEIQHQHGLLFPLKRMLGDLAAYLIARDGGVQRFVIRCLHADAIPTDLVIGLIAPEREASVLFDVTKLRLEHTTLPAPVLELELHADTLPPFVPKSVDLLDTRSANALPWTQLVERLRARLGDDAVHDLAVDPDPRPERASVAKSDTRKAGTSILPPRPTWLLQRPIPLRGPMPKVLAGPERLETGWWDGGDVRRDYYVLELASGQRAWAFCAPGERGAFMLHGWFA